MLLATPLDFSELYIGLQQGLVDAQENPLDIFLSSKFYEQQDYVINTKHNVFCRNSANEPRHLG